jgi:hypothetical protein
VSSIETLREIIRDKSAKSAPPPWQPPAVSDFAWDRLVLSFDQSLSATGYAHLEVRAGAVLVHDKGTLHPHADGQVSFRGTYARAADLGCLLHRKFLYPYPCRTGDVLVEQPLIGPGKRPESALLAGYVIYDFFDGLVTVCPARHVSSVLCGNPHHDKKEIAAAVARYIPGSAERSWSEHSRDAAAQGLAYLHDLAAARRAR